MDGRKEQKIAFFSISNKFDVKREKREVEKTKCQQLRQDSLIIIFYFRHFIVVFHYFFSTLLFHLSITVRLCVCVSPWSIYYKWIRAIKWMDEWNASAFFLRLGSLFSSSSSFALQLCILLLCNLFGPVSLFVLFAFFYILFFIFLCIICVCHIYFALFHSLISAESLFTLSQVV